MMMMMKSYSHVVGLLYVLLKMAVTAPAQGRDSTGTATSDAAAAPAAAAAATASATAEAADGGLISVSCLAVVKQHLVEVLRTLEAFMRTAAGAAADGQVGDTTTTAAAASSSSSRLRLDLLSHATAETLDELAWLLSDVNHHPLFSLAFSSKSGSAHKHKSGSSSSGFVSIDPQTPEQKAMFSLFSMQKLSNSLAAVLEQPTMEGMMRAMALQESGLSWL